MSIQQYHTFDFNTGEPLTVESKAKTVLTFNSTGIPNGKPTKI